MTLPGASIPEQDVGWILDNDAALTALVAERVYPLVVPQDATRPAVAFQRISGPRTYSHSGPALAFARFQVTCEGNSYMEANQVAQAVRVAMERSGWKCANDVDGWPDIVSAPVKRLDFTRYYQE
jgi:hypothetical protein